MKGKQVPSMGARAGFTARGLPLPRLLSAVLAFLLFLAFILSSGSHLVSSFAANLGWISLTHALAGQQPFALTPGVDPLFDAALRWNHSASGPRRALGIWYLLSGRYREATQVLQAGSRTPDSDDPLLSVYLTRAYAATGEWTDLLSASGLSDYITGRRQSDADRVALLDTMVAKTLLDQGRTQAAVNWLQQAVGFEATQAAPYVVLARVWLEQEQYANSVSAFRQALTFGPADMPLSVYRDYWRALWELGHSQAAPETTQHIPPGAQKEKYRIRSTPTNDLGWLGKDPSPVEMSKWVPIDCPQESCSASDFAFDVDDLDVGGPIVVAVRSPGHGCEKEADCPEAVTWELAKNLGLNNGFEWDPIGHHGYPSGFNSLWGPGPQSSTPLIMPGFGDRAGSNVVMFDGSGAMIGPPMAVHGGSDYVVSAAINTEATAEVGLYCYDAAGKESPYLEVIEQSQATATWVRRATLFRLPDDAVLCRVILVGSRLSPKVTYLDDVVIFPLRDANDR
jgi:tetratricopeptide (TPR) repeat protein